MLSRVNRAGQKRRIVFLFFFILLSCTCVTFSHAQKNCLWAVEAGGTPVFLLGSLHILKQDYYPLSKQIERAYGSCRRVVFETDIDGMAHPSIQAKLLTLGMYPDSQTLKDHVSADLYRLFSKKLQAIGLPVKQFNRFKPWLCALTLTTIELQRLGYDLKLGIDSHFFKRAVADGKEISHLESIDFQLNLFSELNAGEQEAFLAQSLKDLKIIEDKALQIMTFWKTGAVKKLDALIKESFKHHPQIYQRFLLQRNHKWVVEIEKMMVQKKGLFIIGGVGHMIGTNSVVDLLRKKGYRVEQQ